ncbi:MAG: hypothetical protein NUW00_04985 [Candidatus Kaiserbacteria bacterium]|nr:hypothetical protein [Candidatus Kaiserbacteria bacterium]
MKIPRRMKWLRRILAQIILTARGWEKYKKESPQEYASFSATGRPEW